MVRWLRQVNELVVGSVQGRLAIFKGVQDASPWLQVLSIPPEPHSTAHQVACIG